MTSPSVNEPPKSHFRRGCWKKSISYLHTFSLIEYNINIEYHCLLLVLPRKFHLVAYLHYNVLLRKIPIRLKYETFHKDERGNENLDDAVENPAVALENPDRIVNLGPEAPEPALEPAREPISAPPGADTASGRQTWQRIVDYSGESYLRKCNLEFSPTKIYSNSIYFFLMKTLYPCQNTHPEKIKE